MLLILGGVRAPVNGPLFALGWIVGVAGSATLFLVLVSAVGIVDGQQTWLGIAEMALGVAFLVLAARLMASPTRSQSDPPRWLRAVDAYGPARAAALGVALSAANPKNLALALGGALALARAGVTGAEAVPALAAYTAIAAPGVRLPRFVIRHDRTVLLVLALAIGAKLLLDGIRAL